MLEAVAYPLLYQTVLTHYRSKTYLTAQAIPEYYGPEDGPEYDENSPDYAPDTPAPWAMYAEKLARRYMAIYYPRFFRLTGKGA